MLKKIGLKVSLFFLKKALNKALTGIDAKIDTPREREVVAEAFLDEHRAAVIKAMVEILERGHNELEKRGF